MNSSSRFSESTAILQNFKLQQDLSRQHQQQRSAAAVAQTAGAAAASTPKSPGNSLGKPVNNTSSNSLTSNYERDQVVKQELQQATIHSSLTTSLVQRENCSSSAENMSSVQQQQHSLTGQRTNISPTVTSSDASGQLSSPNTVATNLQQAPSPTPITTLLETPTPNTIAAGLPNSKVHNITQDMNVISAAYQDQRHATMVKTANVVPASSSLQLQPTFAPSSTSTTSVVSQTQVAVTHPPNTIGADCGVATNVTPAPPITNPDTRTHVVGELYDTERSYVESLQILVEKYMKPLKSLESNRILIESSLVDEIFYTIPEILQHHENFLSALQDRLSSDWDTSQVIGNVFIEVFTNQQIIDTYTAFINNWKNARQAIKIATQAKPAFERYLEAMSREHRNKLTLDALLIMPVQRIPRYELLIKELIKHTPEDHPDFGPLIEAQKEIHELALKIDRAEREMMHQEQLKDLESLIEGHVELQHPQRDFIRYDLVTILGSSALTVTKKERVLFLFCDLLIMTSVKKKASRRSNLQSAFANSSNDVSLLEGNKFKLLLRVPLDQVEVRLENDPIQQQQQQEQQQQLQLQKKLIQIQDEKRKIEANLYVIHQIESLSTKLSSVDLSKINETISEMSSKLKQRLSNLEQGDLHAISGTHHLSGQQAQALKEMCALQVSTTTSLASPITHSPSPINSSTTLNTNQILLSSGNQHQLSEFVSPPSSSSSQQTTIQASLPLINHQHDTNTSLEFLISNLSPSKDSQNINTSSNAATIELTSADQNFGAQESQSTNNQNMQQNSNCEALVVTFASIDRRQAFLQAFIEAKQHRYQQQQQRQQQQRIFSSSITLRLAEPNSPDKHNNIRNNNQQHENLKTRTLSEHLPVSKLNKSSQQQQSLANTTIRNTSAPLQHTPCGAMIVHQMSAPQTLALSGVIGSQSEGKDINPPPCASCNYNLAIESEKRHHRHHHQLMHQPASHPASLNTLCHHYNDDEGTTKFTQSPLSCVDQFNESTSADKIQDHEQIHQGHYQEYLTHQQNQQLSNSSIVSLNEDLIKSGAINSINNQKLQLLMQIDHDLLFKTAPKFLLTFPVNFLNTQHPALQFTCSSFENDLTQVIDTKKVENQHKSQTVSDNSGKLWLCMSNGYVSHVALISIKKKRLHEDPSPRCPDGFDDSHSFRKCYNIVPVVQSAGDICKSHINCAAQVNWSKRLIRPSNKNDTLETSSDQKSSATDTTFTEKSSEEVKPQVEVDIKTVSPPVDINPRSPGGNSPLEIQCRLSESAPSNCDDQNESKFKLTNKSSASTTRLELPPNCGKTRSLPRKSCSAQQNVSESFENRKRSSNEATCQRYHHHHHHHHHHHGSKYLQSRLGAPGVKPTHHSHNHWHHQSQHGEVNAGKECRLAHNHSHHHHHHHQHHLQQNHPGHHLYGARHNTVPITELRRALESQTKVFDHHRGMGYRAHQLLPPANTPAEPAHQQSGNQTNIGPETSDRLSAGLSNLVSKKFQRSATPPDCYSGGKSFRSARMLRHQASLKTSSILAKLVGSASKHSTHASSLRKSSHSRDKHSDLDDNDTDTDNGSVKQARNLGQDDNFLDTNISAITTPGSKKVPANSSHTDIHNAIISPLSSVSSLNSTNSSITVNSVCASSPNRSSCDLLAHSASATCCTDILTDHKLISSQCQMSQSQDDHGIRSRSATVPCRALCSQTSEERGDDTKGGEEDRGKGIGSNDKDWYKISEIIGDMDDKEEKQRNKEYYDEEIKLGSSLWLGCDDGSLLVIDCLTNQSENNSCNECDQNQQRNLSCGNVHSEIKLSASVCDISVYKDRMAFVALSNGQMAIFSRVCDSDKENIVDNWCLTNPKVLTVTANELNSTSKLCLIDDEYLWYSYGRNIFVLSVTTLKLETTIMAPTNDLSLQFTMQSIAINNMVLMTNLAGVWISFKNSHLIQLYDVRKYKLLLEVNLFEPINKMLSYGNEIIRQHKTACLKATSLLDVSRKDCDTLFIGTSAGLVLYLNIQHGQLTSNELLNGSINDWKPQIASLRHGHSGQVKFLHSIETEEDLATENNQVVDVNNNSEKPGPGMKIEKSSFLISGGSGVDVYGPTGENQFVPNLNSEDDSMNHLLLWQL